jgi:hypothetical protein
MKRERWHSLIALIPITVASILLGLLVSGCSKDCPTCPKIEETKHYKGWLYYVDYSPLSYNVYKVDMETDSIVDSLLYSDITVMANGEAISSDGKYLAVWFSNSSLSLRRLRLYNAQTTTLIREISGLAGIAFDVNNNWLLAFTGGAGNRILRLSLPDLTTLAVDTVHNFWPDIIDPERHLLYGVASETSSQPVVYHRGFYSFDYVQHQMQLVPILWTPTDTIQMYQLCPNSNGNILYFTGGSEPGGATIWGAMAGAFDLNSRTLLWYYPLVTPTGGIALSPDGKEVWVTDPGPFGYEWDSGTIFILDAATGSYLQGISLFGYLPDSNPYYCLAGREIVFAPTGDRAYVGTSIRPPNPYGTVVVVDAKKRAITKLLRPDMHSEPISLCICPKT